MISQIFEIIITIKKMLVERSVHTSILIITAIMRNYDKCNFNDEKSHIDGGKLLPTNNGKITRKGNFLHLFPLF